MKQYQVIIDNQNDSYEYQIRPYHKDGYCGWLDDVKRAHFVGSLQECIEYSETQRIKDKLEANKKRSEKLRNKYPFTPEGFWGYYGETKTQANACGKYIRTIPDALRTFIILHGIREEVHGRRMWDGEFPESWLDWENACFRKMEKLGEKEYVKCVLFC